jgi:hypothetical protein
LNNKVSVAMADSGTSAARIRASVEWVLIGAIPLLLGVWIYFALVDPRGPGDPIASATLSAGIGAFLFTAALAIAMLERDLRSNALSLACVVAVMMIAMGASIGRPAEELSGVGTFIGAVGAALGAIKYLVDRTDARAREQRERIRAEWAQFVSNPTLVRAIYMIESKDVALAKLGDTVTIDDYQQWKNGLDQILEFLQRLAYEVRVGDLPAGAVREIAGWYFAAVWNNEHLRAYCERHGYQPVLRFYESQRALANA